MNADERDRRRIGWLFAALGIDVTPGALGHVLKQLCDQQAAQIATLETENAALRVEVQEYKGRRQERWPGDLPPAPPSPRAHDMGGPIPPGLPVPRAVWDAIPPMCPDAAPLPAKAMR